MPAATAPKRATIQRWRESVTGAQGVDRAEKMVRGVRIIGFDSDNNRTYSPEALAGAVELYEGAKVYIDHVQGVKPGHVRPDRSLHDRWGTIRNVRTDERGLVGDITYFETDPLTPKILEMAESDPGSFGLSHDAAGKAVRNESGHVTISEIHRVRSVDLVCDPATTEGLFESIQETEEPMTKKTKRIQLRESIVGSKGDLLAPLRGVFAKGKSTQLIEAVGDQDMEVDEEGDEHGEMPKLSEAEMLQKAIEAVLTKNDMSDADKLTAVREMVAAPAMKEAEDDSEGTPVDSQEMGKDKEMMSQESRKVREELDTLRESFEESQRQLAEERNRTHCRDLLESANVEINDARMRAMMRAENDSERKSLLESWPTKTESRRPGASPGVRLTESVQELPKGADGVRRALSL